MLIRRFSIATAVVGLVFLWSGARRARGETAAPAPAAWKDMNYQQKKAYMKKAVVPAMKPIFQAFDAKKFKTVNCETCHGADGADRKFKMPSNDIQPLPNSEAGFKAKLAAEPTWPKWTDFMANKVEPAMGKLLDVPVFNPKKPEKGAFSCGNCHKMEPAKT